MHDSCRPTDFFSEDAGLKLCLLPPPVDMFTEEFIIIYILHGGVFLLLLLLGRACGDDKDEQTCSASLAQQLSHCVSCHLNRGSNTAFIL